MPNVILPQPDEVTRDEIGNVTWTWADPHDAGTEKALRQYLADLEPLCALMARQEVNRAGYWLVIANPGAQPVTVSWLEVNPWSAEWEEKRMRGVLVLPGYTAARREEGFKLVCMRANRLAWRMTRTYFDLDEEEVVTSE